MEAKREEHSGSGYGGSVSDLQHRTKGKRQALKREKGTWKEWQNELEEFLQRKDEVMTGTDIPVLNTLKQVLRCQAPDWWWKAPQRRMYTLALKVSIVLTEKHPEAWGDPEDTESALSALIELAETSKLLVGGDSKKVDFEDEYIIAYDSLKKQMGKSPKTNVSTSDRDVTLPRVALLLRKRAMAAAKTVLQQPECSMMNAHDYYRQKMRPLAFAMVDKACFENPKHYYAPGGGFEKKNAKFKGRINRKGSTKPVLERTTILWKELSSYPTALPIEYGSSIFVRALENDLDKLRVLIIGPEDTPYANGCFMFDVTMGNDYPNKPPKVQFLTTSSFTANSTQNQPVRFNPNLYKDGKVCLSLLGTWNGPSWTPKESTLLQVLVSLQSLVLGAPNPYFNEPGFESTEGTKYGESNSKAYNKTIRKHTLRVAMLPYIYNMIRAENDRCEVIPQKIGMHTSPSRSPASTNRHNCFSEFDDVIYLHFQLKKQSIRNQLLQWVAEDTELSPLYSEFWAAFEQLGTKRNRRTCQKRVRATTSLSTPSFDFEDDVILLESAFSSCAKNLRNKPPGAMYDLTIPGRETNGIVDLLESDNEDIVEIEVESDMNRKPAASGTKRAKGTGIVTNQGRGVPNSPFVASKAATREVIELGDSDDD